MEAGFSPTELMSMSMGDIDWWLDAVGDYRRIEKDRRGG